MIKEMNAWAFCKEGREHVSKYVHNLKWYNNGERNIRIDKDSEPPKGFVPGRTFSKRQRKK